MIIDTTLTKVERQIASILDDKITYSSQCGFFLTMSQKRAIFWELMKELEAQVITGNCATVEEAARESLNREFVFSRRGER